MPRKFVSLWKINFFRDFFPQIVTKLSPLQQLSSYVFLSRHYASSSSQNARTGQICCLFSTSKAWSLQLQGGKPPWPPTRGSAPGPRCPWTPLGALPPDRHGLAPSNENFCVRPCLSHSCAVLKTTERIKLPFRVRVTPKHCDIIVLCGSPDPPKFTQRALSQSHLAVYISGIM